MTSTGKCKDARFLLIGHCTSERIGGVSVGFEMLVHGFEQRGLDFDVLDLGRAGVTERAGSFSVGRMLGTAGVLVRALHKLWRSDILYLTIGCSRLGFIRDAFLIWAAKLSGCFIVLHLKGGGYRQFYDMQGRAMKCLIRGTLMRVNSLIVLGDLLRDQFDFVPGIDDKLAIVPNGLPQELQPSRAEKQVPGSSKPWRLLYLSNLIDSKGYWVVLEACRILRDSERISFECDFCGAFRTTALDDRLTSATESERAFHEYVARNDLGRQVQYHGIVRGREKASFLDQAHIFVLPTRYAWEGQPISIIEAIAYATPVISTQFRGIPEQVIADYNGLFVMPDRPEELVDSILRIADRNGRYQRYSRNARAHYEANFTAEMHLERLISVMRYGAAGPSLKGSSQAIQREV